MEPASEEEKTIASAVQDAVDFCVEQRLWIRAIRPLLDIWPADDAERAVTKQDHAIMYRAACQRLTRILRTDLANGGDA